MEKLAPEILAIILSHLEPPLAPFAAVSRQWQHAIEERTFSKLQLTSEEDTLQQFKSVFTTGPHRQRLLRNIEFFVHLTVPSVKRRWKLQRADEAAANNILYTKAVFDFFTILAAWGRDSDADAPSKLRVYMAATSSDEGEPSEPHEPAHWHLGEYPMWQIRNNFRYVNFDTQVLDDLGGLPTVYAIDDFEHNMYRLIDPAVFPVISAALPTTKKMDWGWEAPPRRLPDLRHEIRSSAATAFLATAGLSLTNLTVLHLKWEDNDPLNHDFPPGNHLDPGSPADKLSVAMHHISHLPSLQHLKFTCCFAVSKEIFDHDTDSQWPSLQSFVLEHALTTPSGEWYFTGYPSDAWKTDERLSDTEDGENAPFDSDDSDTSDWMPEFEWERQNGNKPCIQYRSVPNSNNYVPLLVAMAGAVKRMPVLKELEVATCYHAQSVNMSINYYTLGVRHEGYGPTKEFHSAHVTEPRWVVQRMSDGAVQRAWVVPEQLRAALQETVGEGCVLIMDNGKVV
ncbi:hypothetical protein OQA88_7717 [Cercophora sp. LCS_1]